MTDAIFPSGLHLNLDSHDAEEMREQSIFWSYEHKQFSRGEFQGKIIAAHTKRLQIAISYRSTGVFMRGGVPPGTTIISLPLALTNSFYYRGQPLENNQAIALQLNEEIELHTSLPSLLLTIVVSSALLERQAIALTGKSFAELRSQERLIMCQNDQVNRTNHLVSLLMSQLGDGTLYEEAEELLENEILETVLLGVGPCEKNTRQAGRLVLARKAEEYIRNNLENPLSINELCLATGATERTLHLGFKERFGVSPIAFMRMMKLNEVRQELRLNNSGRSVTEIAVDWGFYHLGRFSGQYSQMFGELPNQTKKNEGN